MAKKATRRQKIQRLWTIVFLFTLALPLVLVALIPDYTLTWLALQAIFLVTEYILMTSIYVLGVHDMLVSLSSFTEETYRGTYISGAFAETKREPLPGQSSDDESLKMINQRKTYRGLFGTNIVFLLWPFWTAIRLPTTGIPIRIHATRIYTRDANKRSPSVPIKADTTMVIRLAPDLESFITAFEIQGRSQDLTEETCIYDNAWKPDQEDKSAHTYQGPLLAQIMLNSTENTILEAVRMMGNRYPWIGNKDVRGSINDYETRVLGHLSRWESLFHQAGVLNALDVDDPDESAEEGRSQKKMRVGYPGPAALSVDFNIEDIDVEDENVRKSLGRPLFEAQEAEAQEIKGDGEGRRLQKIAERTQVPAERAYQLDAVKSVGGNINLFTAGENILDVLGDLTGNKRKEEKE